MKRLLVLILLTISYSVKSGEEFGGYGALLERVNIDASYSKNKEKHINTLKEIPPEHIEEFSRHAYRRYIKSQSQRDYTGILDIISATMLSRVVENVMLSNSKEYYFLDHEYYFSATPGIAFENEAKVFEEISKGVKDGCELLVWNAILIAKRADERYRFEASCKQIKHSPSEKNKYTKEQLRQIYYQFRAIDGY